MTETEKYLDLYAQTVFAHAALPAGWPAHFWIITAYPPTGEAAPSAARLAELDAALVDALRAEGADALHRVTGGSPDGAHTEPGWAAALSTEAAMRLGRQFRQVAIFRVEAGRLAVVDCENGRVFELARGM